MAPATQTAPGMATRLHGYPATRPRPSKYGENNVSFLLKANRNGGVCVMRNAGKRVGDKDAEVEACRLGGLATWWGGYLGWGARSLSSRKSLAGSLAAATGAASVCCRFVFYF